MDDDGEDIAEVDDEDSAEDKVDITVDESEDSAKDEVNIEVDGDEDDQRTRSTSQSTIVMMMQRMRSTAQGSLPSNFFWFFSSFFQIFPNKQEIGEQGRGSSSLHFFFLGSLPSSFSSKVPNK